MLNQEVEMLLAMFKDTPKTEIEAILASVGNVNRAAEALLKQSTSHSDDSDDDMDSPAWSQTSSTQVQDINQIMNAHRLQLNKVEVNRFTVDREELWTDSIILFKSPGFNPHYPLRIRFHGEPGIDAGGVSREFATLLRNALFSSEACLFEGKSDRRLPICNGDAVLANVFVLALIAKVTNATTASDLNEVTSQSFVDALMAAGWVNPLTVANKDVAMWQLVVHETLLKRKTPLDHFTEGLKVLNLLKLMQSYPEQMSLYFTHTESSLNKEMVISLFNLHTEDHDEANERCSEYFIQAIGDLEEERGTEGLKNFLSFLTGLDEIPPLGLPRKIEVKYLKDASKTLFAETCLMVLKLPTVHTEYSQFKENFMLACTQANIGFGCA